MINDLSLSILDTSPLATFVLENRQIIIANHAVERVFGWKPGELIGQSARVLYPAQDVYEKVGQEIYSSLENEQQVIKSEYPCRHKDGSIIFCRLSASRIGPKSLSKRVVVTYENITELRRIASKLNESETLYRTLAEGTFAGVYVVQDGKFKYMNHYATSNLGYRPDELIGRKAHSIVHAEDRKDVQKFAREMLNGRRTAPYHYRALNKKGEIRWIMETVTGIVYEGRPAVLGNNMDITEINEAKTRIEESNELRSSILDAAPYAIMYIENRRIIFANNAVESVFGWKPEELIGHSTRMLFRSEKDYRKMGRMTYATLEKSRVFDESGYIYKHKDGREMICRIKSVRIGGSLHKRRIIASHEDITEQIRIQSVLRQRTQELEIKTQNLEETNITIEETNTALNVILKRREADKAAIEESVVNNVNKLIIPCLQQIKKHRMDNEILKYLSQAESYLKDLVSPFLRKLSQKYPTLTHKEVMVANFLKDGKSSKEIAELLNISVKGVEFHRNKIRSMLGIKNTNTNLRSHLLMFDSN